MDIKIHKQLKIPSNLMVKKRQNQGCCFFLQSLFQSQINPYRKPEVYMHKHNNIKEITMFCMEAWNQMPLQYYKKRLCTLFFPPQNSKDAN